MQRKIGRNSAADVKIRDKILRQSVKRWQRIHRMNIGAIPSGRKDREPPSLKKIHTYQTKDVIVRAVEQVTGRRIEAIANENGHYRQIVMGLLYRIGGLKGEEIGRIMGVGYTSVNQKRSGCKNDCRKIESWRCFLSASSKNVTDEDLPLSSF